MSPAEALVERAGAESPPAPACPPRQDDARPTSVIMPRGELRRLLRRRRARGLDRFDEVWNGTYMMAPSPDWEHGQVQMGIGAGLLLALGQALTGAEVVAAPNLSDRPDKWTRDYRIPDVVVRLPGNPSEVRGAYLLGGPDFAVEILSPGDRAREKFEFYARLGVRELLLVERQPWQLELYRLQNGTLLPAGVSSVVQPTTLASAVLPVTFRLVPADPRPRVEVASAAGAARWLA